MAGQCGADFEACGGDLVGTWTYSAACLTLPENLVSDAVRTFISCKENPVCMKADFDVSGTVTFAEDGTFSVVRTSSVMSGLYVPLELSCEDRRREPYLRRVRRRRDGSVLRAGR